MRKIKLKPIRPSLNVLRKAYNPIEQLIDEMTNSFKYWLSATYKKAPPPVLMAQDALAANSIQEQFDLLSRRWTKRFNLIAKPYTKRWMTLNKESIDDRFLKNLRDASVSSVSVDFTMTEGMRNVFNASVNESVSLIKDIPQSYLTGIQSALTTAVTNGRDLHTLVEELEDRAGITKRRAAFIARQQVNNATAVMHAQRGRDLGLKIAVWRHSAGGKHPRSRHVAFNGHEFDVNKGHDFGDGLGFVLPGQAYNCRCTFSFVIEGF